MYICNYILKSILSMILLLSFAKNAFSQEKIDDIEVIGISPLPGIEIDRNKIPNASQSLREIDLDSSTGTTIVDLLGEKLTGVTIKDVQNSPFQKNIDYRGFTAAPLLGESQGLAVYLNGTRINEGFGDTLQWELVPEAALTDIDLMSSNPVFGLNALGGSLALTTKKGLDFLNTDSSVENHFEFGGADWVNGNIELGAGDESQGLYVAMENSYDGGWRDNSAGDVKRLFINYGKIFENSDFDFTFMNADSNLNGNGVSPTELLKVRRESVFTWPDFTSNKVYLAASNANFYLEDDSVINTSVYYRRLIRDTLNADELDAEECAEDNATHAEQLEDDFGTDDEPICGEADGDNYEVLIDQYGNAISNNDAIRKYGLLNKSSTMTVTWGGSAQYNIDTNYLNKMHNIIIGASIDKSRTAFHSRGELGQLHNNRTVTNIGNSEGGFITLESIREHTGSSGGKEDANERGDVGSAQLASKTDYYGIYINDLFAFDDKTDITISARANLAYVKLYDHLKTSFTRTETNTGSHRYFRLNPAIGMTHNYDDNLAFRASYKEANRTPAPVELSCASPSAPCRLPNAFVADPPLDQVITRGVEFGAKGKIDNHYWEATYFHFINFDDIQFVSTGTGKSSGYFKNFGETQRRGIELALNSRFNNGIGNLNIYSNYSYLQATFESAHTLPAANHPTSNNDIEAGDYLPGMPEHTFKTGINQEFSSQLNAGLNMTYSSGVFLRGDESNQLKKTNPYMVFNADASWKLSKSFSFFARVDNLLDSKYETMGVLGEAEADEVNVPISELGDTGSGETAVGPLDPRFYSPGAPRSFFIGLRVNW